MRGQLTQQLKGLAAGFAALAGATWRALAPLLAVIWRLARPVLRQVVEVLLALVIVFEEWGWRPLAELLGRFTRWRPWAILESYIVRLPPYAALLVFVLPTALLLPLKFLAVFLVAKGKFFLAGLLFAAAKVVATALVARLFLLTQPALMQIGWFARVYDTFIPLKDALVARVHASWAWRVGRVAAERARRAGAVQWRRWRPAMLEARDAVRAATGRLRARAREFLRHLRDRRTIVTLGF